MPFAYYQRLNTNRQRIYRRSDAVHQVPLPAGVRLEATALRIRDALAAERRDAVEAAGQELADALCTALRVPVVSLVVHAVQWNL